MAAATVAQWVLESPGYESVCGQLFRVDEVSRFCVLDTRFVLLFSVPRASVFLLEAQGTTSGFSRQEVRVIVRVIT